MLMLTLPCIAQEKSTKKSLNADFLEFLAELKEVDGTLISPVDLMTDIPTETKKKAQPTQEPIDKKQVKKPHDKIPTKGEHNE